MWKKTLRGLTLLGLFAVIVSCQWFSKESDEPETPGVSLSISINTYPDTLIVTKGRTIIFEAVVTDESGSSISYLWEILSKPALSAADFGIDDEKIVQLTPDLTGSYEIRATFNNGTTEVYAEMTIYIISSNLAPSAVINSDKTTTYVGESILFDGTGSSDPESEPLSYSWNFGDGSPTVTDPAPSYAYAAEGTYTVSLTVTDTSSESDTATMTVDIAAAGADLHPEVNITAPTDGDVVSGTITVEADASDDDGIVLVSFYAGSVLIGTDTSSPYSVSWDTSGEVDGDYLLSAVATDTATQTTTDDDTTVTVDNADLYPEVNITSPLNGETVSGTITITASGTDDDGIVSVSFYAGSTLIGSDTSSPYSVSWNTTGYADGSYVLSAKATDTASQITTDKDTTVTVENIAAWDNVFWDFFEWN